MYEAAIAHLEEELAENLRAEYATALEGNDAARADEFAAQIAQFEAAIALLRAQ